MTVWLMIVLIMGVNLVLWGGMGLIRFVDEAVGRRIGRRPVDSVAGPLSASDIAVIVPAHNEGSVIGATLQSLRRHFPPANIHVVSDGSTDDTVDIARQFAVQVTETGAGRGKAGALAFGIQHFRLTRRFAAVLITDADTRLTDDYLPSALPLLADPQVVAVAGCAHTDWSSTRALSPGRAIVTHRARLYALIQRFVKYGQAGRFLNAVQIVPGFASIYSSSALDRIVVNPVGVVIEDFHMTFEIYRQQLGRVGFTPRAVARTQDPDSLWEYIRQTRRWSLGFWQTVLRYRGGVTTFSWALALLIVELVVSSAMLITAALAAAVLALPVAFPALGEVAAFAASHQWVAARLTSTVLLVGIVAPDLALTLAVVVAERRLGYLLYAWVYLPMRIIDAGVILATMTTAWRTSSGIWRSPVRRPSPAAGAGRRLSAGRMAALLLTAFLIPLAPFASAMTPAAAQPPSTVVSLTFDDSTADHADAARILERHGMAGTFYVISGYVGTPGYLTRNDLDHLAAAGHEIGGHTVDHPDLRQLPIDEARREICLDRGTLQEWGFHPTSFAYPFAEYDQTTAQLAVECGYNSARALGDLRSKTGCNDCDVAETIPPEKPYELRAADNVDPSWTVADLQALVLNAEPGGGWVPLVFHQICAGCSSYGMKPEILDAFTAWLAERASRGTVVKTVNQVIGGTEKPTPRIGFGHPLATPVNADLESLRPDGQPQCWISAPIGRSAVSATLTGQAHSGKHAMRIDVRNHQDGDAKLLIQMDLGDCAPPVESGRRYALSAWYRSDARVQFAVYTRDGTGRWSYWTSGPFVEPSGAWAETRWTTPDTPAGTTGLSYGLSLQDNGFVETDDYGMHEETAPVASALPAPAAPISPVGYLVIGSVALVLCWLAVRRCAAGRSRFGGGTPTS
jgi:cellulose synthase/poly-beta-1,6-N-acetylglucosamine synthase-like glycosyltransferase/peptidoglycan/xylan/chitin deacetylase (PgdA/CDA1 family)